MNLWGGGNFNMNYVACEQFMDYAYGEESIVTEGFINSLKNTLKKICASLYRRCNFLYERNKTKHPKIANIFKRLAMFFKKHSNIVDKANTEQDVKREKENIDKENIDKGKKKMEEVESMMKNKSDDVKDDGVSEEFKQNVASGDVMTVRSALANYLIIDKTFQKFDKAIAYAEQYMKVIEKDGGVYKHKYDENSDNWNEDYLIDQKGFLLMNFSQKRIDHVKKVIRKVWG